MSPACRRLLEADDGDPVRAAAFDAEFRSRALVQATERMPGGSALPAMDDSMSVVGSFLASLYGDLARIESLSEVVAGADPAVAMLSELLAVEVARAHAARLSRGPEEIEATIALFNRTGASQRSATGELAISLSNALDALRANDPAEAIRRLAVAHTALNQALADDTPKSFIELIDRVDQFAAAATSAQQIYQSYNTALEP